MRLIASCCVVRGRTVTLAAAGVSACLRKVSCFVSPALSWKKRNARKLALAWQPPAGFVNCVMFAKAKFPAQGMILH
jgi:hypothetical protein